MKQKILLLLVMLFSLTGLNAQRIGIKAGFSLAQSHYRNEGYGIITTNLPSMLAGITGEIPLVKDLYLNSGLQYARKGVTLMYMGTFIDFPISYLEVPVSLAYKYDLGKAKVYAMGGPYAAYGLSAKSASGGNSESIGFGSGDDELKRLDYGANFASGIEFNRFNFGVSYCLGLVNISNLETETIKTGVFSIFGAFMINWPRF